MLRLRLRLRLLMLMLRLWFWTLHLGRRGEAQLDLERLSITAAKHGEYVPSDSTGDHFRRLVREIALHRLERPR